MMLSNGAPNTPARALPTQYYIPRATRNQLAFDLGLDMDISRAPTVCQLSTHVISCSAACDLNRASGLCPRILDAHAALQRRATIYVPVNMSLAKGQLNTRQVSSSHCR